MLYTPCTYTTHAHYTPHRKYSYPQIHTYLCMYKIPQMHRLTNTHAHLRGWKNADIHAVPPEHLNTRTITLTYTGAHTHTHTHTHTRRSDLSESQHSNMPRLLHRAHTRADFYR